MRQAFFASANCRQRRASSEDPSSAHWRYQVHQSNDSSQSDSAKVSFPPFLPLLKFKIKRLVRRILAFPVPSYRNTKSRTGTRAVQQSSWYDTRAGHRRNSGIRGRVQLWDAPSSDESKQCFTVFSADQDFLHSLIQRREPDLPPMLGS